MKTLLLLTSFLLLLGCEKQWPAEATDLTHMPAQQWFSVPLAGQTKAADGSSYKMLVKKASSDDLIIFFGGGGVAWDDASASRPIKVLNFLRYGMEGMGFYFNKVSEISMSLKGLLDTGVPSNPFLTWNATYIPYATGDFHIGSQSKTYKNKKGKNILVYHNGTNNVKASLEWIYEAFPQPRKVFVIGASAGAFGSSFWLQEIAEHYQHSQIYHLADSGYLYSPKWTKVAQENWGAKTRFPLSADLIEDAMRSNSEKLVNRVTILQSHTATDGTLIHFQAEINDRSSDSKAEKQKAWAEKAMSSMKRLAGENQNYFYFVTDHGKDAKGATAHTLSSFNLFYTTPGYREWVTSAVLDETPYSVGKECIE